MKKLNDYINRYENSFLQSAKIDDETIRKLKTLYELILKIKKNKKKILIFGNGGSAAISSHFSVDMTKIGQVRTVNFNESDLLTCFSNDYGYENWMKKCIEFYSDYGDMIILVSSSGESKNVIRAAKTSKNKKLKVVTFTGFKHSNKLKKLGDLNFWVNSSTYNHIENIHQYWLLLMTDLVNEQR
jgi:D-sedoheptulose 7-phosphate isomerase